MIQGPKNIKICVWVSFNTWWDEQLVAISLNQSFSVFKYLQKHGNWQLHWPQMWATATGKRPDCSSVQLSQKISEFKSAAKNHHTVQQQVQWELLSQHVTGLLLPLWHCPHCSTSSQSPTPNNTLAKSLKIEKYYHHVSWLSPVLESWTPPSGSFSTDIDRRVGGIDDSYRDDTHAWGKANWSAT